jgi:hypothetical protein
MAQRAKRRFYTASERAEIWDRWRKGEGLKSIGRVFGKSSGSIFSPLMPFGGMSQRPTLGLQQSKVRSRSRSLSAIGWT